MVGYLTLALLAALLAFALYVRLAPSDPARWHVEPDADGPVGVVTVAGTNRATLYIATGTGVGLGNPIDMLARMDTAAMATPRTKRLAGSISEGRITWITRSALWGFPDYTTAEARSDGLYVEARSRFGKSDLGMNAWRLRDWLSGL